MAAAPGGPQGEPVAGERPTTSLTTQLGKAVPYGVYDMAANAGWVNVGTDHDTAAFAVRVDPPLVECRWQGPTRHARRLLITADAGGSNGYRTRAWKMELAALALRDRHRDRRVPLAAGNLQMEQAGMAWWPPRSDEMLTMARRARSPSR